MYYTVYKITHKVSGKFYIGMHRTKNLDDNYMGSGLLIGHAIKKYGLESFMKETLHIFDNEEDMIAKEIELVNREFCLREDTYNIMNGGEGSWDHVNSRERTWITREHAQKANSAAQSALKKLRENEEWSINYSSACSVAQKKRFEIYEHPMLGKNHTEDTKLKMSNSLMGKAAGKKNSQFGTMWITNDETNRKIKKTDEIPEGWRRGRKIK